jgi:hypothetical protein
MSKCRVTLAELALITAADQKMQRAARMRLAEVAPVAAMAPATPWVGPIVVTDLAPQCCAAHGCAVRPDKICVLVTNLLSLEECASIIAEMEPQHETEPPTTINAAERSQFRQHDRELSAKIWSRMKGVVRCHMHLRSVGTAFTCSPHPIIGPCVSSLSWFSPQPSQ